MTEPTLPAGGDDTVAAARGVLDLGLRATAAYDRPDLGDRLGAARDRLANPGIHLVVLGEFKQGKSSLVNALVGAPACPVDDDIATAVPTYVRHGDHPAARLILDGDPPRRVPAAPSEVRRHAVGGPHPGGERVIGVELLLPRSMLAGGLVLVDTPGLGGLASAHSAASLAAASIADAVLFVTDASQELTATELETIRRATGLCDTVAVALTKTDLYPSWRRIRDLDAGHLRAAGLDVPVIAVSSMLRTEAVRHNDSGLNAESGYPALTRFVSGQVAGEGRDRVAVEAAAEVVAVAGQLATQFEAERAALEDPAAAQRVMDQLAEAKARAEQLRAAVSRWNQTLGDGIADLSADVDHDLRSRIRAMAAEAEEAVESGDPADTWPELQRWLESRASYELVANYTMLRDRAADLSRVVAEHFRLGAGDVLGELAVYDPKPLLTDGVPEPRVAELRRMTARKQTLVAMRNSYSGILMFTMLPTMIGLGAVAPLALPLGLLMGRSGLREEKKRQLGMRQAQVKNAVRRYGDEIQFVVGKDSRDTLRRIQRQLRDHYAARAEELGRSTADALRNATADAKRSEVERAARLRDLRAELDRLRTLTARAAKITASTRQPAA